jgi:alcohol dehydrogenase
LTVGLPPALTAATGIDTFVHAFEAYVGIRTNPFSDQLALAGLRSVWKYLPRATKHGNDMEARQEMMLAALWGGIAMDQAGLGLVHALSGPLSSHFHLHHGLANAIILPHVVRFNLSAVPIARRQKLNKVFGLMTSAGEEALVEVLIGFLSELGLPSSLDEVDVSIATGELDIVAEETTRMVLIKNNPRPATQDDCRKLLEEMA